MKKLMALMIVMSFFVVSSGSALADEPATIPMDRHAVWTKWFDENGNRLPGKLSVMGSTPGVELKISTPDLNKSKMKGKVAKFNFIRETKTYDYAKDRGNST